MPALTSLRFLAAFLVLLFHFPPPGVLWTVVAGQGHVGVNIFFVLSGFLITARYAEAMARGEIPLREYFIRRAARILPLYYAVFVLSQVATGDLAFSRARLPEWTLTQGLFGESVHHLVVPTSWSLTVEECFYALAPLLFFALAAARRRWPGRALLADAVLLVAATGLLLGAGAALWTLLDGRGPGFLRSPPPVMTHTIFGRFADFACGALAAIAIASPSTRQAEVLRRPRFAALAAGMALLLMFASQAGMHAAGGTSGPRWMQTWAWGLLLAPAAAALIAALAQPMNPVGRLLESGLLVYLGKVSYALYLVQLTPIGRGLFYPVLPRQHGGLALILFYVGLIALSALLYEIVERPARNLVLRAAGLEGGGRTRSAPRLARLAGAGAVAAAMAGQAGTWAVASLGARMGPVTLREVRAAGVPEGDLMALPGREAAPGRDVLLVGMPRRWREGWGGDLHAPSGLWVFADGVPVRFSAREPETSEPAAFYRGPRAEFLALRLAEGPRELVVVRKTPGRWLSVHVARLLGAPSWALTLAGYSGAAIVLALLALRGRSPSLRTAVTAALAALMAWWTLELHREPWSPFLLAAECALLLVVAARARPPARQSVESI